MAKDKKDSAEEQAPAPTEAEDHAANEKAAEAPAPVDGRRDGNGALIVN